MNPFQVEPGQDELEILADKRRRYLADSIEEAFKHAARTVEQLFRHVTFDILVTALSVGDPANKPQTILNALLEKAGAHPRLAPRMRGDQALAQLTLAISEGVTTLDELWSGVLSPKILTEYVDHAHLGAFLADSSEAEEHLNAERELAFLLVADAFEANLLNAEDIVRGYGMPAFREHLPKDSLYDALEAAVENGLEDMRFGAPEFLEVVKLETVLKFMPATVTWNSMITPKIFVPHGFTEGPGGKAGDSSPKA